MLPDYDRLWENVSASFRIARTWQTGISASHLRPSSSLNRLSVFFTTLSCLLDMCEWHIVNNSFTEMYFSKHTRKRESICKFLKLHRNLHRPVGWNKMKLMNTKFCIKNETFLYIHVIGFYISLYSRTQLKPPPLRLTPNSRLTWVVE